MSGRVIYRTAFHLTGISAALGSVLTWIFAELLSILSVLCAGLLSVWQD